MSFKNVGWLDFGRNNNAKDSESFSHLGRIDMSFLNDLKLVEFKPQNAQGRIFVRRRKLVDKIEQQIKLVSDASYAPTKLIWAADENGVQQRREVSKRIKRWWVENIDGSAQLTIRYGSKPLEISKGKNAILCENVSLIGITLEKIKQATINGELDVILNNQVSSVRNAKSI